MLFSNEIKNKHINTTVITDINFHVMPYCQVGHSEFLPKLVHFFPHSCF